MAEEVKKNLENFRQVFFREKYRFDQGNAFLVFVNFALLVITLVRQSGGGSEQAIPIFVGGGLLLTWLLGYILDKIVRVQEAQESVVLKRSPIWKENFQHHGNQNEKLEKLIEKIERLEKRMEKIVKENE